MKIGNIFNEIISVTQVAIGMGPNAKFNHTYVTFTGFDGKLVFSKTPLYKRKLRKIFGCNHEYKMVLPMLYCSSITGEFDFSEMDWFCPKCWSQLTKEDHLQFKRDMKLKEIGV